MILSKITDFLESIAPLEYQEEYDNAGLLVGQPDAEIKSALISLDLTDVVLKEALDKKCNLIISHHPIIFKGIKSLTGKTVNEKIILSAIKKDIAIYAIHTNLDNIIDGVNNILANKLGLKNIKILTPKKNMLRKLVTFCPINESEKLRQALFSVGAGHIGNYNSCSFNVKGFGTFKGLDNSNPFVGKKGVIHWEEEIRIEVIYPLQIENTLLSVLNQVHPYEEVAFDIYPIKNEFNFVGAGVIGDLEKPSQEEEFLIKLKKETSAKCIRHSSFCKNQIKKVAICGGSGSFLIKDALKAKSDIFITGDIKYHDFTLGENQMIIADIGHFESEVFSKELIYSYLIKNFPNFAVQISEQEKNPVNYL